MIESVQERWWHRMLRVLVYTTAFIVFAFCVALTIDESRTGQYHYNFEPGYASQDGEELECSASEFSQIVFCGGIHSEEVFLEKFFAAQPSARTPRDLFEEAGIVPGKNLKKGTSEAKNGRPKGYRFVTTAHSVMNEYDVRYRIEHVWDKQLLLKWLSITVAVSAAWLLMGLVIYKIILFIAHGHTRITSAR